MRGQFVDTLRLTCKGGHGGNGLPKFGGIGGQGGCVYLVASEEMTLDKLMKKCVNLRDCSSMVTRNNYTLPSRTGIPTNGSQPVTARTPPSSGCWADAASTGASRCPAASACCTTASASAS